MLDSLGKSLSNIIDERLSNPFVVSFIFAWCGWNYKFLVLLFSETPATQTFELIRQISFPTGYHYLLSGFLLPLLTTLFYIYCLPFFSKRVNDYWRKNQLDDQRNRQQYEDKKLLSEEESREYRARERGLNDEIERLFKVIEQAKKDLQAADAAFLDVQAKMTAAQEKSDQQLEEARQKNSALMERAESALRESFDAKEQVASSRRMMETYNTRTGASVGDTLTATASVMPGMFSHSVFLMLLRTIANGVGDETLLVRLGFDSKENIEKALGAMLSEGLVTKQGADGLRRYSILQKGREFLQTSPM